MCRQHRGDMSLCGLQEKCCFFYYYHDFCFVKRSEGKKRLGRVFLILFEMCSSKTSAPATPLFPATPYPTPKLECM